MASTNNDGEEEQKKKPFFYYVKRIYPFFLCFVEIPILTYNSIPCPVSPEPFSISPVQPSFEVNSALTKAKRIIDGELDRPHSLVVDKDHLYTGTQDGFVNDVWKGTVRPLAHFGKLNCGRLFKRAQDLHQEPACGRPMGIRMDKDGSLLVVDAYFGLFRVNKTDGAYETLYTTSFHVAQKQPRFLTDLDIGPDGKIYFVDASTKYYKNQYHYALLEMSSSGRLLMYDPKTKVTLQLADQLAYPFGVQLSKDKTGVLITSPLLHAIYRYDLKTRNVSVWTEGLPGMPLGIRYSESSDSYWLAMSSPRSVERPNMFENLAKSPSNRRYAAKFVSMDMIETLRQEHGFTNEAMVAEVTASGTIGRVLQDSNTNPLGAVTEAQHVNGVLYTSSFFGADAVHTVNLKHKSRS